MRPNECEGRDRRGTNTLHPAAYINTKALSETSLPPGKKEEGREEREREGERDSWGRGWLAERERERHGSTVYIFCYDVFSQNQYQFKYPPVIWFRTES